MEDSQRLRVCPYDHHMETYRREIYPLGLYIALKGLILYLSMLCRSDSLFPSASSPEH